MTTAVGTYGPASATLARAYVPALVPPVVPTPPVAGAGQHGSGTRSLFDGVSISQAGSAVGAVLTNAIEQLTGVRDPRLGSAANQVLLGGAQLVRGALRATASKTDGVVSAGSGFLSKVLPIAGIASGIAQVYQGWKELGSPLNPLELIHSKRARTGVLSTIASALMFVPGVGGLVGSAGLRLVAAANELDVFHGLDAPKRVTPGQFG